MYIDYTIKIHSNNIFYFFLNLGDCMVCSFFTSISIISTLFQTCIQLYIIHVIIYLTIVNLYKTEFTGTVGMLIPTVGISNLILYRDVTSPLISGILTYDYLPM